MTTDVVALTPKMPDPWSVLAGLLSGGPDREVRPHADGAVVQLCDERGRPLLSVEAPLLIQVEGEAERLLGADAPPVPFWWTEARATTGVPEAEDLAGTFASRIAALNRGSVWPPEAARPLDVVEPDGATNADSGPTLAPADAQPAVDVLTDQVAVVIQDRPVIAMTAWLSGALTATAAQGLGLQIVTPPGTALSPAVRPSVSRAPSRWVVQDEECGYYDGLTGAVLSWRQGMFRPVPGEEGPETETPETAQSAPVANAFRQVAETGERQLTLSFRTVHPADDRLVLGGPLEAVFQALTGRPPAGWGTAEPANSPWSLRQLTDLARSRAPEPTWFVVTGAPDRPALATLRVHRTTAGVEQDMTVTFGYGADEHPPLDALPAAAEALATRHHLVSLLAQIRKAPRDLAVRPRFEPPGAPAGFAVGPDEVRAMPGDRARRTPLATAPLPLGPATRPGLYYPFRADPADLSGWQDLARLLTHLKGE
ncbi:hypothetical protein GCM10010329_28190 [Streptomyces spiroverticillatus]|uniref:Uncharacterized protein n=1 Tax=Streptomyces finlayi TaxID=67296 RepID=A0A919C9N3_9ACTN|nr:DUF6177 family protein [Streptomyces finlayi]GHA04013.1 hypothetical protein GCM10010329_28190 [Streptomyces spiroverticillatus]GHC88136.1 hypothetical protein GCM10010334_20600 [Streptomyces finlayi]